MGGVIRVVVDVKFYAVATWLFGIVVGIISWSSASFIRALFPVIFRQYWFILPYLFVVIISPVINKSYRKKESIYVMFAVLVIIGCTLFYAKAYAYLKYMWLFVIWYYIGGLIRKYNVDAKTSMSDCVLLLLAIPLVFLYIYLADTLFLSSSVNIVPNDSQFWRFSIFPILGGVGLFCIYS